MNHQLLTTNIKVHVNEWQSIRMMLCTTIIFFFKWQQWYNNLKDFKVFDFNYYIYDKYFFET